MDEVQKVIKNTVKYRFTNNLYVALVIAWVFTNWQFLVAWLFVSEDKIIQTTGLLKNDYLYQTFFSNHDLAFWARWLIPVVVTVLVIWVLPKTLMMWAFKATEEHEKEKTIFKFKQDQEIEAAKVSLLEVETKVEKKAIEKANVTIQKLEKEKQIETKELQKNTVNTAWEQEYEEFKKSKLIQSFDRLLMVIYEHSGHLSEVLISKELVAFCHTNELIIFLNNGNISLTEKGKYFVKRFTSDR